MVASNLELIRVLGERLLELLVSLPQDSKEALRQLLAQESGEQDFPDESAVSIDAFIGESWGLLGVTSELLFQNNCTKASFEEVFRNFHRLVGNSALFGFNDMTNLCRYLEVLFERLAKDEIQMTPELAILVSDAIIALRTSVLPENKAQVGNIPDLNNLTDKLKQFMPVRM